jgi:uncharacterized protein YbjT (DUF2867 family)
MTRRKTMYLVTGANGNAGSLIVKEFAKHAIPVRALVRSRESATKLFGLHGVEIVEGDMSRTESLGASLRGVSKAIMISTADESLVDTQCAFIDSAVAAGVKHIVKFSGQESGINFDAQRFRFTRMHEQIEDYLERTIATWTHLRPSQFMQVYLREAPTIVARDSFYLPCEDIALSPIDLEDVAKIAFKIAVTDGHQSKSYQVTGPEALTMDQIAAKLSDVVGRTIRYVRVSRQMRADTLLSGGVSPMFVAALDEQAEERVKHKESLVDTRVFDLCNLRPTTFLEFAQRHKAMLTGTN